MDEMLRKLEVEMRAAPAYAQANALLDEQTQLEQRLPQIERELDALGAAAKLARIDRLRKSLLSSAKLTVLAG